MSEARLEQIEQVTVLTVYDSKESKTYLFRDWEKYGDKATVIKHIKYDRPPVVKLNDFAKSKIKDK